MARFSRGFGTFKVDYALSEPVPWSNAEARESAVVHVSESLRDLARFTQEVRHGKLPEAPYLVVGQQSLADSLRAPLGQHTLYCYSHVPSQVDGGWDAQRERFADRVSDRIEGLAPGFKTTVLERKLSAPPEIWKPGNANLARWRLGRRQQWLDEPAVVPPGVSVLPLPHTGKGGCSFVLELHPLREAACTACSGYNAALAAARDLA